MKWLAVIGLIIGGWGLWYISSNANLEATEEVVTVCRTFGGAELTAQVDCANKAFGDHELRQNLAIVTIVVGTIVTGVGVLGSAHQRKRH
jgi:hypothetical protein